MLAGTVLGTVLSQRQPTRAMGRVQILGARGTCTRGAHLTVLVAKSN
jgi:hypothetical protein